MLRHRKDEILHRPEFEWKTFNPGDDYYFDDAYRSLKQPDSVNTLECWDYEDTDGVDRNEYVRFLEAGDVRHFGPDDNDDPSRFNERFERWLKQEGNFVPLRPDGAGKLRGGMRLALCDRPLMDLGMTIRKDIFEAIEREFQLHDATLPAFIDSGGCFLLYIHRNSIGDLEKVQIVVKAVQKVEITNCLVSLTYDVRNSWTNAFACGDSLILGQQSDEIYGNQQTQLLDALACGGKHMWTNPLLVPIALFQMCTMRTRTRTGTLEKRLHGIERALGVVNAGSVVIKDKRPQWPLDIDIKRQTRELHSTLPQILFLIGVVQWQKRYGAWLLDTARELQAEPAFADQKHTFEELISIIQFHASSVDGMLEFFQAMEGRTQSQINLLFSVVGQVDAINSQNANHLNLEVARSAKEDGISMTTFTLINAVYLPLSFIATLFSMGMFEWGADSSENDAGVVSESFWVFWASALPLTLLTLSGWYIWYQHASRKWNRKLDREDSARALKNDEVASASGDEDERLQSLMRKREAEFREAHLEKAPATKRDRLLGMLTQRPIKWRSQRSGRPSHREKTEAV